MAKERNVGEQHNQEMEHWTNRIKVELTGVSEQFVQLQQFYLKLTEEERDRSSSKISDRAHHSDQIVKNLQRRFTDMSSSYRASLTARSEILKSQKQRRELYGDQPVQDFSKVIHNRSSNDLRQRAMAPSTAIAAAGHHSHETGTAETHIDIPMSQMQLQVAAPSTLSAVIY